MATTLIGKFPHTLEERLELGPDTVCLPATFEEFVALLDACDYSIEYQDQQIVFMSIASDLHEKIVANLLFVFGALFRKMPQYNRYGSNRHVFVPEFQTAYSPDASIVFGEPDVFTYSKGKTANLNPWLVVEVLSDSTRNRDWGQKLPHYKQIESMRYILLIEQDQSLVTLFSRSLEDNRWKSEDFDQLNQVFLLEGQAVALEDIYENIKFS